MVISCMCCVMSSPSCVGPTNCRVVGPGWRAEWGKPEAVLIIRLRAAWALSIRNWSFVPSPKLGLLTVQMLGLGWPSGAKVSLGGWLLSGICVLLRGTLWADPSRL